jgi:acetyltransferase-like isoleucine patch superfamily enzyme
LWGLRFLAYKLWAGRLRGLGYIGRPIFFVGKRRFYADSGLGIFPGARIEILDGKMQLGKNVRIGHGLFVSCASMLTVGNNVTMSANVFISTTENKIEKGTLSPFSHWPVIELPVEIGDNCFIGYGVAILPGTKLGDGSIVGANAVVRGQYPPGSIIAPAKTSSIGSRI